MAEVNIYCDESNHLENDHRNPMVLGSVYCPVDKVKTIHSRIKDIKQKYDLPNNFEIKWTKVSPAKEGFYKDLIDYFFDNDDLHFRCVVINKNQLNHKKGGQTHDEWYYKMYFELLNKILDPENKYYIYLDEKDTQGTNKIQKLHEVLCNGMYDFERSIIRRVQEVKSIDVQIIQLADLLIGALQFALREDVQSETKSRLVNRIKERSKYDLSRSTLVKEPKFNIFHWKGSWDI